jgi:hypothetical protein
MDKHIQRQDKTNYFTENRNIVTLKVAGLLLVMLATAFSS